MSALTLDIQGMTCGSCERKVMNALQQVEGVEGVEVNRAQGQARVEGDPDVGSLVRAVQDSGYTAAVGDSTGKPAKKSGGDGCC